MAVKSLDTLVAEFSSSVAAQTGAIEKGDADAAKRFAKKYVSAFNAIRDFGDAGRDALVPLLKSERSDVRAMTASFLLRHCTAEALIVLEDLASGSGLVSFEAREAIKRWEEGTWALDPS
jgi:hypothetical protein